MKIVFFGDSITDMGERAIATVGLKAMAIAMCFSLRVNC